MKVLVTGGTGLVGEATIAALLQRGHEVRILSRFGDRGVMRWPRGVEARAGDVASAAAVNGSARGCDAIVHIAGIEEENPPDLTFEKVNVLGTRHVVAEANRAGVRRLVFVSSLGADTGESEYHKSKRRAEQIVRGCSRPWVILRPGGIYGPGDKNLSLILKMVRTYPAIPLVDGGNQRFQPLWHEDAGKAIAAALDATDVTGETLEIAGPDATSMNDLLDRLERLVGRTPRRVSIPGSIASVGVQVATALGFELPVSEARLTMLKEENVIPAGRENALASVLKVNPTPLDKGLKALLGVVREQLPSEGVGPLVHKRYWADIEGSFFRAGALRDVFRRNIAQAMPFETTQDTGPITNLKKNQTFTVMLPIRGALSMRVEDITPDRITCATLEGHPLAGLLTFDFLERGTQVRFEVGVHARGADVVDAVLMATIGELMQDANWLAVVERVVKLSGGRAPEGAQMLITTLDEEEAEKVEKWASELVVRRLRGRVPPGPAIDGRRRAVRVKEPVIVPSRQKKTAKKKTTAAKKTATRKKTTAGTTTKKTAAKKKTTARKKPATGPATRRPAAGPRPRSRPAARGSRR
jgi:NADH dehydrogenase